MVNLIFILWDFPAYLLHSFRKKLGKGHILIGFAGTIHAETGTLHFHLAQNHLWVSDKIAVHRDAVFIRVKMYPLWLGVDNLLTLLQNKNVACDLRACVCFKGIAWQADCPQQLGSLGDILPHLWACLIHCAF